MSNALYDKYRQAALDGDVSWSADTIKAQLVDTSLYTVNLASHEFLTSIAAGARVGSPVILSNKTVTDGVADADDCLFSLVSGSSVEAVVLYKDTGTEATSRLIAYIDTATGLPFTPSGINQTVVWNSGSNKIFKL